MPNVASEKYQAWQQAKGSGAQDIAWLNEGERRAIITLDDVRYPPLLKMISDPPPLLFACGEMDLLQQEQLAVVGSRNATRPALQITTDFVQALCAQGWTITSGLALGVDAAAHQAALECKGRTIAVVATGLDRVYPAKNRALAHAIARDGLIISEFPIGTGVRSGHFPRRNRLISGMSQGVLVSEASLKSGSLITARMAMEQGREVFAIPGSIHNPMARGCHYLIKQGAKLVETAQDIIEELQYTSSLARKSTKQTPAKVVQPTENTTLEVDEKIKAPQEITTENEDAQQQVLLDLMGYEPWHIDALITQSQLTSAQISAMLLILELDGWVESLPGSIFQRIR